MRRILLAVLAVVALSLTGSGAAAVGFPTILVKFRDGVSGSRIVTDKGDRVVSQTKTHVLLVEVRSGLNAAAAVSVYASEPGNEYAEANGPVHADLASPNDPSYSSQWALSTINAFGGWQIFPGHYTLSGGVTLAVVDSGVDASHPDFAGRVMTGSGANCVSGTCVADPAQDDSFGHGTHVAGIAAAATGNGLGVAGLAYDSPILPVKVLDSTGVGPVVAVANGLIWAADRGARVINVSISTTGYSKTLCDAVAYATTAGAVVVASAGNNSTFTNEYPAACPGSIGVAATDINDVPAPFSDYGYPNVFLSAPGVSILSTLVNGTYGNESGTSMSAPFVTGLAALLVSENPSRTVADVRRILAKTAAKVGTTAYTVDRFGACGGSCTWNQSYGYGRIDVGAALTYATTPHFSVSSSTSAPASVFPAGTATYSVSVGTDAGYQGTAALSVTGLPAGASADFSPSSVSAPGSSQLTIVTSASTPIGSYPLIISGSDGSSTEAANATLTVVAPDFSVAASPSSATILRGKTSTFAVSVGADPGFTGSVTLSATGQPSGVTASFAPISLAAPGSSVLTLTATTSAVLGNFTVTVKGLKGTISHTTTIALTVAIPDFSVAATPSSATVLQGQTATYSLNVAVTNGFTGSIAMSVTGYPSLATVAFSPGASVLAPGSATLAVTAGAKTAPGTYTLTITGKSATKLVRTKTVTLVVNPVGDFSFTNSPTALTVARGGSGLAYVYLVGQGGFYCTVALTKGTLPIGVTATFSKTSLLVSGISTYSTSVKFAASSTTAVPGSYTVTLNATCGPIVHTTPVTLTIT